MRSRRGARRPRGLSTAHARRLGYDGSLAIQVCLVRAAGDEKPLVAYNNISGGQGRSDMARVNGSRPVQRHLPVAVVVPATADVVMLRDLARELAVDVLHQFGVSRTAVLR